MREGEIRITWYFPPHLCVSPGGGKKIAGNSQSCLVLAWRAGRGRRKAYEGSTEGTLALAGFKVKDREVREKIE